MKLLNLKDILQKNKTLWFFTRSLYRWITAIMKNPISCWYGFIKLFLDWLKYRSLGGVARLKDFYPCLNDRTIETGFDPQYFYQAAWAMDSINISKPLEHADVGSDVKFVAMLTSITKVKFVDIRPLNAHLENLECLGGSILNLPFENESVKSLSTLHVIEHVGLGRYGDPIDPLGAEKAGSELTRVLSVGGMLYVSLPIGTPRVQFNGLRTFSPSEVHEIFKGLTLVSSSLVDNHGNFHKEIELNDMSFDEHYGNDFALGCFVFKKEIR